MTKEPTKTPTRQFAMLVLAPVDPKKLAEAQELLREIGRETIAAMEGRPPVAPVLSFKDTATVHYARLVLLDQDSHTGPMLAFATDYDGPEGDDTCKQSTAYRLHVDDLVKHAHAGLDKVFQCCAGYSTKAGGIEEYFAMHLVPASTFYVGSSGRSRNQIIWEAELRRRVNAILDQNKFDHTPPERVRDEVLKQLRLDYPELPTFPAQPDHSLKVTAAKSALVLLGLSLYLASWFIAAQWFSVAPLTFLWKSVLSLLMLAWVTACYFRRLEQTDPQFQPELSAQMHRDFATASTDENYFLQNQLTHLVAIKPGPLRWVLIRIVFMVLQFLATNLYNKGKLGDIPSIHFARWALIPNRGVLFFSNFDSSWQSYLGDFIDKASSGLTAVWSNTVGYPRTKWLVRAGSRDAARFLAWTRHHQLPTQVWYCAYPGLSIVNINDNTEIRRGLADPASLDAATWLFRLRGVDRLAADKLYSEELTREPPLPLEQIQGLILKGYSQVPEARFLLFQVRAANPDLLHWLATLPLTSVKKAYEEVAPTEPFVNIAFTYRGLRALGVDLTLCDRFSTPFVQGSDDEYRARVNGDVEESHPSKWQWGNQEKPVHIALLVYARSKPDVLRFAQQYQLQGENLGLTLVEDLEGTTLPGRKEHFGFRDGIAQPTIKGSGRVEASGNTIAAGEILLGHRDEYGNVSNSPVSSSGFNFGLNGTYLVFRQLEQDVAGFWRYCAANDSQSGGVTVASKMVGRWPSGAPLVRYPDRDPNDPRAADEDNFTYLANDHENDRYGARCPFGAHIRRSNPRDWNLGATRKESLDRASLHRIVRRGRPYGAPLVKSMATHDLISAAKDESTDTDRPQRGLQFLCVNANIERQYEFIQQQWCNNPKFAGLNSDPDPLLGLRRPAAALGADSWNFEIQSEVGFGLRSRCTALQNFVRVVGSSYFFMPSIPAVGLLSKGLAHSAVADAIEETPPDEQFHVDNLIDRLREKMKRDYVEGKTLRDAHPKMHGCVRALFKVEANLDPSLRIGLFAAATTYHAWVRSSNQEGKVSADSRPDIRGAAIKLLDVPGAKLLDGEEHCSTHDIVTISHDAFVTKDVAEFDGLIQALVAGRVLKFCLTHPRVGWNLFRSLRNHSSPLDITYFSVTPYLLGTHAVKYMLKPAGSQRAVIPKHPSYDYLRDALRERLERGSASFDFMVQVQGDPRKTPIEDPGIAWRERHARFKKVATLEIFQQTFDTPGQREFGENLSFNPWRCLPEHRPLGGINRARRQVYRALSNFRHHRNAAPAKEPTLHNAIP
jgi:Dyp-type peroxidase family